MIAMGTGMAGTVPQGLGSSMSTSRVVIRTFSVGDTVMYKHPSSDD